MTSPSAERSPSPRSVRRRLCAGFRPQGATAAVPGLVSFLAQVLFFKPRNEAACALLRPSANASAKLANNTVNQSQMAIRENECRPKLRPWPCSACSHRNRGKDRADIDDEHDRVAPLHGGVSLAERGDHSGPTNDRVEESQKVLGCNAHMFLPFYLVLARA